MNALPTCVYIHHICAWIQRHINAFIACVYVCYVCSFFLKAETDSLKIGLEIVVSHYVGAGKPNFSARAVSTLTF